jgi:hypothetical protein
VTVEHVGKYLGKTIEDAMGRPIGKLVGLTADIKDEVTAIQIAHSDGEVAQHSINFVKVLEDRLILQQTWRVEAEDLRREHDIIARRRQALDLLLRDGDIDQAEFDQLRSTYDNHDREIMEKSEALKDTLKQVESKLDQQISDLQSALTNNKMLYSSSEINEETYQAVTESIRAGLEIARKERKDIANISDYLNGKEITETQSMLTECKDKSLPQTEPKPSTTDVVVIKINEISKT